VINEDKFLVVKPRREEPYGASRLRFEDTKPPIKETGRVDWIHLAEYNLLWLDLVNMLMNLRVP
jgi:hypothetical protein